MNPDKWKQILTLPAVDHICLPHLSADKWMRRQALEGSTLCGVTLQQVCHWLSCESAFLFLKKKELLVQFQSWNNRVSFLWLFFESHLHTHQGLSVAWGHAPLTEIILLINPPCPVWHKVSFWNLTVICDSPSQTPSSPSSVFWELHQKERKKKDPCFCLFLFVHIELRHHRAACKWLGPSCASLRVRSLLCTSS